LRDVEAERIGQLLLLDGGDVEIDRRVDRSLGERHQIIDRLHRARTEDFSRHEFGRLDRGRELLE